MGIGIEGLCVPSKYCGGDPDLFRFFCLVWSGVAYYNWMSTHSCKKVPVPAS